LISDQSRNIGLVLDENASGSVDGVRSFKDPVVSAVPVL